MILARKIAIIAHHFMKVYTKSKQLEPKENYKE